MEGYKRTVCHMEDYVCACGKRFIPSPLHVYKNPKTHKKYCSWTCFRNAQKENPGDFYNQKRKVKD